jgi:hypothetical protein
MVWFGVNVERFEKTGDTPLWVNSSFRGITTKLDDKLDLQDAYWVPVTLKRDVEYPEMLDGVVESLKHIADVVHEARFPSG